MKTLSVVIISLLVAAESYAAAPINHPSSSSTEQPAFAAVALYDQAKKQPVCITPATKALLPNIRGAKAVKASINTGLPACDSAQLALMKKSAHLHYGKAEARQAGIFTTSLMVYYGVCTVVNLAATQSNFPNGGRPVADAAFLISATACLPVSGLNLGAVGLASMIYYQVKPMFVKEKKQNR